MLVGTLVLTSCGSPVATCKDDVVDCCLTDSQCEAHFGPDFPYCLNPGKETGQCVECVDGSHCEVGETCEDDATFGKYCAEP